MRPIATHNRHISDFASWRGLFVMAGVSAGATNNGHVFRSDDGQAALWLGNVDDLWQLGAPAGIGGPWMNSAIEANAPSDPYLMFGYKRKVLEFSHTNATPVTFTVEVDFAADNTWSEYARFTILPGQTFRHVFPDGYSAFWARLRADAATTASATFTYGAAAPEITNVAMAPGGAIQLNFTGGVGQPYTVRATGNVLMAAVLARGATVVQNAAIEPEITALARFLTSMGARIQGIGTNRLEIEGVDELHPTDAETIPDRIEAGTFLLAAAITHGSITLTNVMTMLQARASSQ